MNPKYNVKKAAPPTSKKMIVGTPVPKNSWRINPSQKFEIGWKASFILSSIPNFSCVTIIFNVLYFWIIYDQLNLDEFQI